jgi:elongation factor G
MISNYDPEHIRNIAIIGHNNTGKTTLTEALLYMGKAISHEGRVEDKNTQSDFTDEEKERGISIHNSILFVESEDVKVNIIDTPGMADFCGDVRASLRVAEAAVVLVDGVDGLQMETEKIWHYADEYNIPRILFVNKMDKEKADFFSIAQNVNSRFKKPVVPIQIPIGKEADFKGIIDLLRMKAIYPEDKGQKVRIEEIPAELKTQADEYRIKLIEKIAESDDKLIEKFLNEEPLTDEEIEKGLLNSIKKFLLIPVVCGSAVKNIGALSLLRMIIHELPSPTFKSSVIGTVPGKPDDLIERKSSVSEPFSAFVFKTTQDQYSGKVSYVRVRSGSVTKGDEVLNAKTGKRERINGVYYINGKNQIEAGKLIAGDIGVILKLEETQTGHTLTDFNNPIALPPLNLSRPVYSVAVFTESKNDEEKLHANLARAVEEDPSLSLKYNAETKQTIFSGMGDYQIRLVLEKIEKKTKIKTLTELPKIAYRETITKEADSRYKHKKQSGGHGQYGDVHIRIAPLPRSGGYKFIDEIVGGVIPKQYIPGVQKGLDESMIEGTMAGYPVQDVEVHLIDGSYHSVDSSEFSFKQAAFWAFKESMKNATPKLLEPIMKVTVNAEKDYLGDVLGDLNGRRGKVLGMDEKNNEDGTASSSTLINANVPHAELLTYALDLKAKSSGRATFDMVFSHYEIVPERLANEIIDKVKKEA